MSFALRTLIQRLRSPLVATANVIAWGCPIPSFGDLSTSSVATVGINPSNREFVDQRGDELVGAFRRFHTLKSLGIVDWNRARHHHVQMIARTCSIYFQCNPYRSWFQMLDKLIVGTGCSYFGKSSSACHLDIFPYATSSKWTELQPESRAALGSLAGDTLGLLLRDSNIKILILNGRSVVKYVELLSGSVFDQSSMPAWALDRANRNSVTGIAFSGCIGNVAGIPLGREIRVLGFNHNLQSSFGVTSCVREEIANWISSNARKLRYATA